MESEKSKKPDFGKLPLESFDKLNDYFKDLLSDLENYESYVNPFRLSYSQWFLLQLPEKLVKKILKEVGFESCDRNTVKTISLMTDKLLNDIIQSIALIKTKSLKPINPQTNPEENNTLNPRSRAIKKTKGGVPKSFQLRNLLEEMEVLIISSIELSGFL